MVKSMYAAVAGLRTHQQKMDVIGNNIANVNTFGFKKARVSFADQFYSTLSQASNASGSYGGGNPQQVGYGSQVGSIDVNMGTGSMANTDMGMDAMILGQGFFLVGGPEGKYSPTSRPGGNYDNLASLTLTRVGSFGVDGQGSLITSNKMCVYGYQNHSKPNDPGYPTFGLITTPADPNATPPVAAVVEKVLEPLQTPKIMMKPDGDPVILNYAADGTYIPDPKAPGAAEVARQEYAYEGDTHPAGSVPAGSYADGMQLKSTGIGADGTVSGINDLKQTIVLGKIAVANVPNPNALEAQGLNSYKIGANTGTVTGEFAGEGSTGPLGSGKLEMSNVDLAQEFSEMIVTQRGFQANTRIITVTDEMLQELVNIKR